jgi:dipeptidyl aminopeptidase/acylaminoacyl peptidase
MNCRAKWFCLALIVATSIPPWGKSQTTSPPIPSPDTIRAQGVPPIPASVQQALNRYQNIRTASFQDWAADGAGMYILTRFADVPQVHFVEKPGGARTQLTFLNERVLSVSARPKHDQFLYMADEGGAENYQLYLQDRKGGEARGITDGKSRNAAPKWSPSGELLAWSSNARNGRDMDLYVASPLDPHFVRRFKDVSGQWTVSDWSPDEKRVVAVEYISINEAYIHIIEVATGKTETVTPRPNDPKAERVFAGNAKWSKDGKSIYYITDKGSEFRQLVRRHLDSGQESILSRQVAWDIEEFDLNEDGSRIAWLANMNGVSYLGVNSPTEDFGISNDKAPGLQILQPLSAEPRPQVVKLPAPGVVSGLVCGRLPIEGEAVGFTFSGARGASDSYVFYLGNPSMEVVQTQTWTTSETGGLDTSAFADPQRTEYPTFDGRKIPAFVYRPSPRKFPGPRPVLINIHGGPESQFRPSFLARLNYLIDELGLVLIFPNVRGSSGYGKTYLKLDNGKRRADAVKDIGSLLDWIAQQKDLDKSRVGVIGGSYGGFMSLAVQTTYNDRIKAGIDIVGISNFVSFLKNTQGYRRDLRRAEYGDERDPEMRSFLEQISPLAHADKIHTPILIVQGQNDPRVPISEAEQMLAAIRKNKVPVWYVVGTNEGHGFAKKANQDYFQAVEVEFLRRFLLGTGEHEAEKLTGLFPVSGVVTFKGEPLAAGRIVLHPVDLKGQRASGVIRDGRYRITTARGHDGALPGTYKVTIDSDADAAGIKVPARYSDPEVTGLRCMIQSSANMLNFELQ